MTKFRITYRNSAVHQPEEVEALTFVDAGDWIDFFKSVNTSREHLVLRVRASDVARIEQVKEP